MVQGEGPISGGFGDVRLAKYQKHWWAFWTPSEQVAVKTLRPAGDETARLRVAVVSL